ncbi:MAG: hypothetical protein ACLUW6_09890 [Coriobacteriaceae bacterium]
MAPTPKRARGVLVADVLATPPWTRISRMIATSPPPTSSSAANKPAPVVGPPSMPRASRRRDPLREVSVEGATVGDLSLQTIAYQTATMTLP